LTETITSPTIAAQMKQILTDFPEAKWHQYEPVNRDNARAGAIMAFGQDVNTIYDFSKADRILSLGSDFLSAMPGTLRYARDYARRRGVDRDQTESGTGVSPVSHPQDAHATMNRLYVIESTPTITGANADHRFSIKPGAMADAAFWLARSNIGSVIQTLPPDVANRLLQRDREPPLNPLGDVVADIAGDLQQHIGKSM